MNRILALEKCVLRVNFIGIEEKIGQSFKSDDWSNFHHLAQLDCFILYLGLVTIKPYFSLKLVWIVLLNTLDAYNHHD